MASRPTPEQYEKMQGAVGKAATSIATLKAKNKRLKAEKDGALEEVDKLTKDNVTLRERVALLESQLKSTVSQSTGDDNGVDSDSEMELQKEHEEEEDEVDGSSESEEEEVEAEGIEDGIEPQEEYEEDREEEEMDVEEDANAENGASARYGDSKTTKGDPSPSDATSGEAESKSEGALVDEKCAYFFSVAYTGAAEDTQSVATALGACSPTRVAKGLYEAMRQVRSEKPGPRLIKIRNLVSLLYTMATLTLRIEFRQYMMAFKPGKSRKALKKAPQAVIPGILYLRELLSCIRERVLSEWIHHLNSVSLHSDTHGGQGQDNSSYFVKTMLSTGDEERARGQEQGQSGVEVPGAGDIDAAMDHLRHILAGAEPEKAKNKASSSPAGGEAAGDSAIRCMSAVYLLASLSVGQTEQVAQYLEMLLLLESTPRSSRNSGGRSGSSHNWPLLGAMSAIGLASSSTVFDAVLPSFSVHLQASGLAQRLHAMVPLIDAGRHNDMRLLLQCTASTRLHLPALTATTTSRSDQRVAQLAYQVACRREGFLRALTTPVAPYKDGALHALAALHLHQDSACGALSIRFLLGTPSTKADAGAGTHPLSTLCKWLGPLPALSSREDRRFREALVDAFRETWTDHLPQPSSSSSREQGLSRSAGAFGRWSALLCCFSMYEYDHDPPSGRCYSQARALPVTGRLDNPGYGWRVPPMTASRRDNSSGDDDGSDGDIDEEQEQTQERQGAVVKSYALGRLLRMQTDVLRGFVREASHSTSGLQAAAARGAVAMDSSDDDDDEVPAPPIDPARQARAPTGPSTVPATVRMATTGTLFARCLSCCCTSNFDRVADAVHTIHRASELASSFSPFQADQLSHLRALVSAAVVEVLFVLLSACARGCIDACTQWRQTHISLDSVPPGSAQAVRDVLGAALDFYESVPAPWAFPYSAESVRSSVSAHSLLSELDAVRSKGAKKRPISQPVSTPHAQRLLDVSARLPCFTINLARRPDRHTKATKDACDAGLLPLALNAFDAFAPSVADTGNDSGNTELGERALEGSKLSQFMRDFRALARASGGHPALAIHECVPEGYVSHSWDSAQNHDFDPTCVIDEATPLTPSERCCAMSHLAVWLVIDFLRRSRELADQASGTGSLDHHVDAASGAGAGVLGDLLCTCSHAHLAFRLCRAGGGWEPLAPAMGLEDWYLILEDDAVVAPEYREPLRFRRRLAQLLVAVPTDWDILYLGHAASARGKGKALPGGLFCKPSYLWQLHGYVLRGRAVEKLLSLLPIRGPVDNYMASLVYDGSLCAYSLQRQLIVQEGNLQQRMTDSNIDHSGRTTASDRGQGLSAAWKSLEK